MSLAKANKDLKFDNRLIDRHISVGEMSKEELQKHLDSLPDLAHNVETFTIDGKSSSADEAH